MALQMLAPVRISLTRFPKKGLPSQGPRHKVLQVLPDDPLLLLLHELAHVLQVLLHLPPHPLVVALLKHSKRAELGVGEARGTLHTSLHMQPDISSTAAPTQATTVARTPQSFKRHEYFDMDEDDRS